MPPPVTAASITVAETLKLLDGPFRPVADGVAEDRYAFWLGSGISVGRVDGLKELIPRVLEFLRARIDITDAQCRFRKAIGEALALANVTQEENNQIDLAAEFNSWPLAAALTQRLTSSYAKLLDVQIAGEDEDYLLWHGIKIAETFANPDKEPDVEHLCIVLLSLEGVATELATANWDGLIEKAAENLTGDSSSLVVCVRREDLQAPRQRAWLYKFHGCAVRAVADEAHYRPFLVGRASQIHRWTARPEHQALIGKLVNIIACKPTLMMGLSAQDANIQSIFALAESHSPWGWPGERPSFVLAGDRIGADQQGLLQNVYRASLTPYNRHQVIESALIRAYAAPLLVALALYTLCAKLRKLVELAPSTFDAAELSELQAGVVSLRDHAAAAAEPSRIDFIRTFINHFSRAVSLFRDGEIRPVPQKYNALTELPVHRLAADPTLPASGLRELAVALGVVGIGLSEGYWELALADATQPDSGAILVRSKLGSAALLFTANGHTAVTLKHKGHVPSSEAILVHSATIVQPMARSPRTAPGRTGKLEQREVSVTDLLAEASDTADLVQRFREAVAI